MSHAEIREEQQAQRLREQVTAVGQALEEHKREGVTAKAGRLQHDEPEQGGVVAGRGRAR